MVEGAGAPFYKHPAFIIGAIALTAITVGGVVYVVAVRR
jgi:hypothetical protein